MSGYLKTLFVIYDGRAEFQSTDDCSVYGTAESKGEAIRVARKDFTDGVVFEYDVDGKRLINERRVHID